MRVLRFLSVLLTAFCLNASAVSLALSPASRSVFSDTTLASNTASVVPPVKEKKGFFLRLKEKAFGVFIKASHPSSGTSEKKRKLLLVSVLLLIIGLGMIALTGSLLWLVASGAGLVTGIAALTMKVEPETPAALKKEEPVVAPKHKSWFGRNLGWLIALTLVTAGLVLLLMGVGWGHF